MTAAESVLCALVGVIFVTAFLPHDMCTPQGKDFVILEGMV
jgi:hypothetical protein